MEFTEALPSFGGLVSISPNARLLGRIIRVEDHCLQLVVQAVETLHSLVQVDLPLQDMTAYQQSQPSKHFPPLRPPRILPAHIQLLWSPDSQKILVSNLSEGRAVIVDMRQGKEAFLLKEAPGGLLARCIWAPDSKHILTVLHHQLGIKVWSVGRRSPVQTVTDIKSSNVGVAFCRTGNTMAVLHRKYSQDYIVVYSCTTWKPVQFLRPPEASFIEDIAMAEGKYSRNHNLERTLIYAWEMPCLSSRVFVFESDGSCKVVDVFSGPADDRLGTLGFSRVVASPSNDLAALITGDNRVVLWNALLQKPLANIGVSEDLARLPHLIAFKEKPVYGEARMVKYESGYDLMITELGNKQARAPGAHLSVKFSADSSLMAILSPGFPHHLWIYHVPSLAFIAVMAQLPSKGPIKDFAWHPERPLLALVTDSDFCYFWQPEGCCCIPQPFGNGTRCSSSVSWVHPSIPSGQAQSNLMLLASEDHCCLALPDWITS